MTPTEKILLATIIATILFSITISSMFAVKVATLETELAESQRRYEIVSNLSKLLERNLQEQIERNFDLEWQLQNRTGD